MGSLAPTAVLKQIENGSVDPVYLLVGEDDAEKAELVQAFEGLVEDGLRAFNVERIHVGDATTGDRIAATVSTIVSAARTLPMMAPRRVVIVMQAEAILVPKRESEAATRALDELQDLLERPEKETVLVLTTGVMDRRTKMFKLLTRRATLVECGTIESSIDAERWIKRRIAGAGQDADAAGVRLLAERDWNDVRRLRNDVDRLLLYTLGAKSVTLDDVRQIVGPAALQDPWAMTNAIERGNGGEALRQLALMLDAGEAPEKILGQLGWLVRTKFAAIRAARLRPSIDAVFRTDLDLKRSAGDPRILLERLVVELCGNQADRRVAMRDL